MPWILALPYLLLVLGIAVGYFPWPVLAFFVTLPWTLRVCRVAVGQAADVRRMSRAVGGVLAVHFVGGLAVSGGLLVG